MKEPKLNKDGLPIGVPVSFETLQKTLNKHKEAAKNASNTKQPKTRRPKKLAVSDVEETKGQKEAENPFYP